MNKKTLYITISVFILTILMSVVDAIIKPQYFIKSIIKVILFLLIPLIYFVLFKDEVIGIKNLFHPKKKDFLKSLLLGISVYVIIIIGYFLFRNFIDFSSILNNLTTDIGVNKNNFVFVALYISFINSLLEEFFFRGYSFITLKKQTNKKFAYIFSSLLFAIYHIGMMLNWFNIAIFIIAFIGLAIGGCIFNYLNEKCNHIYPSWIVHMLANFAINTVGFIMFGIL